MRGVDNSRYLSAYSSFPSLSGTNVSRLLSFFFAVCMCWSSSPDKEGIKPAVNLLSWIIIHILLRVGIYITIETRQKCCFFLQNTLPEFELVAFSCKFAAGHESSSALSRKSETCSLYSKTNSPLQSALLLSVEEFFNTAAKFSDRFPPKTMLQYLYENKKMGEKLFCFDGFIFGQRGSESNDKIKFSTRLKATVGTRYVTLKTPDCSSNRTEPPTEPAQSFWFNILAGFLLLSAILVFFLTLK